ncbi:hypothetical protein EDD37DRAFT_152890 [Exophiala viscosa]|uniref:uncharacterized protein n=1 Tax=Exophiala viscosa TaxID=2486360 RepID=UPI00219875A6|nr:hypothetical protein EDD37DRAFT_152890 [Exophiala viscosa]
MKETRVSYVVKISTQPLKPSLSRKLLLDRCLSVTIHVAQPHLAQVAGSILRSQDKTIVISDVTPLLLGLQVLAPQPTACMSMKRRTVPSLPPNHFLRIYTVPAVTFRKASQLLRATSTVLAATHMEASLLLKAISTALAATLTEASILLEATSMVLAATLMEASLPPKRGQDDRHYGRDAAVAGAAGTGAYEYEKHRPEQTTAYGRDVGTSEPASQRGQDDRHLGRDTAVAGATGTGAYEYEKHRPEQTTAYGRDVGTSDPASQRGQDDRHLGRDTAVAGATGTGAYEYEKHRPEQTTGSGREEPTTSTRDTRTAAPASEKATSRQQATEPEKEQRHTGRDAALAGAAGAGAGALGEHDYSKQEAEKAEAQRQKDLAEQEAARQKQYEKDQKAAEKQAHKEEKQHAKLEKKIEKEHKKDEKQHHKELEKEEKHHQKEVAAAESEQHKRHEKEAAGAAAVGTGAAAYGVHEHNKKQDASQLSRDEHGFREPATAGAVGTGAYPSGEHGRGVTSEDSDRNRLHKDPPQQKKQGILSRIFKRRKNKDTGEDEDYSTDEEDTTHHHRGAEAAAVGAGAGGAGLAAADADRHHERNAAGDTTASAGQSTGQTSYEAQSGGLQKPSYNPFSKQDPSAMSAQYTSNRTADTNLGAGVGTNQYDGGYETRQGETATGTQGYRDANEGRLGVDQGTTGYGSSTGAGVAGTGATAGSGQQQGGFVHKITEELKPLPEEHHYPGNQHSHNARE